MNKIITINREFGSGGRELGKRLADEMNIAYCDSEILTAIAVNNGLAEAYIRRITKSGIRAYPLHYGRTFSFRVPNQNNQTKVLITQQQMLNEFAAKSDCVIVGRCADVLLSNYQPLNQLDMDSKFRRCREKAPCDERLSNKELRRNIQQIDTGRTQYCQLFYALKWGGKENYQLCINTSGTVIYNLIPSIASYAACWFGRTLL